MRLRAPPPSRRESASRRCAEHGPISVDRFAQLDDGRLELRHKRPWRDGTTSYDKTTGKLVGAVQVLTSATEDKQICLAGPSTLAPLSDCTAYYDCYPNDAGVMQGHCYGDAGVDGVGGGG